MALGVFGTVGPYHILSYGTLLGTEVFNSFVAVISYTVLPRSHFGQLQKALTPYYFSIQTVLPVVMALTFPADRTAIGMSQAGLRGVFESAHRYSVLTPLAISFITGFVNLAIMGPATTKVMLARKHQETRDGKKYDDKGPHSEKMQDLNNSFTILHSISSILNVIGSFATLSYGFYLGERLH